MINIFGAGPTGAVIARRYAEKGEKVIIYEVRDHIAGNLYDYISENGVIVHKYGPHIFQTSNKEVIEYVNKFSNWKEFRHKVNVVIKEKEVPLPINFKSIDILFDNSEEIKEELKKIFPNQKEVSILDLKEKGSKIIEDFTNFIYENIFENYTTKMWGINPEDIDKNVLKRVPVKLSYDDGYFNDTMQAVPEEGYTKFISNIIDHPNIEVVLNAPKDIIHFSNGELIVNNKKDDHNLNIYTGPLDSLFNYEFGEIPYRSLKFEFEVKKDIFNSRYVVNYPSHPKMTRITDYGLLSQQDKNSFEGTVISKEFPGQYDKNSGDFSEPYYPINNDKNNEIVSKYLDKVKDIKNLRVIGRLAEFKYKQMWQSIHDALEFKI